MPKKPTPKVVEDTTPLHLQLSQSLHLVEQQAQALRQKMSVLFDKQNELQRQLNNHHVELEKLQLKDKHLRAQLAKELGLI